MAYRNELGTEKSLIWITEIPFDGKPRRSPNFSLMGSEWFLEFTHKRGSYFHDLCLHRTTAGDGQRPLQTFKVRTHVTDPKITDYYEEKNVLVSSVVQQTMTETNLWNSGGNQDTIFKTLPSLYVSGEIKFVCKFYGQPQSAFQLEIVTRNEKSVQISEVFRNLLQEVPRDIESLSSDFSRLLEKEILTDVKLECGGRTFQAHRSVLAARSEVFRAMFQNGMLESKTGAVKIPDIDVTVLEKLLQFVYTGKTDDLSEGTIADVYEAADKYAVLSFKTACAYWMERNLTVENCVKYLKVGYSHSDDSLKATVVSFITENPSVLKSEAWITLSKELPVLATEVLQTYVSSIVP